MLECKWRNISANTDIASLKVATTNLAVASIVSSASDCRSLWNLWRGMFLNSLDIHAMKNEVRKQKLNTPLFASNQVARTAYCILDVQMTATRDQF
jgi:hypothetical protein